MSDGGVTVGVRTGSDGTAVAGYGGVSTCGSVWVCPQCAAVIATRRASELADVLRAVDNLGGSSWLVTLTVQHSRKHPLGWSRDERATNRRLLERASWRRHLAELGDEPDPDEVAADELAREALDATFGTWDAVGEAWAAVTSGGTWVKDQRRHGGLLGWVRAVETTHGRSGWHVHVHALLCFADDPPLSEVHPIAERMFTRWKRKLNARGYDASGDFAQDGKVPGFDVRRAEMHDNAMSNYLVKLAHEVTSGHRKEGRRPGGRTPMQLLADAVETYAVADLGRWAQWEQASAGRRQLTWSGRDRDLRALAQLGPEQTDEEIAAEELPADDRVGLPPETWGWVRAGQHETTVLTVTEDGGIDGLTRWLDQHDQAWIIASPAELRPRDPSGRPLRRPSDRPPRWSDEAHGSPAHRHDRLIHVSAGAGTEERS
ncbi:hypothetical protein [Actinomycetospora soli]|uniref:hypothetical protein n=1 Tax=Actinomycetospora soli TaxID=2893887 RepID=UPI001E2E8062|nr:hypothetical protein [Actinomycetospora soli]MCD2191681.1 hypothetical protein [Actinomycetospora soli]